MFHIAICDDRLSDLNHTLEETEKWLKRHISIQGEIDCYHSAEELKAVVQEKTWKYDLYILDIVMHGTNGIEFGKWIQSKCGDALMIYVTTSVDYALDAFDNHAVRYLMKPVREEEFWSAMDTAYSLHEAKPKSMIMINTTNNISSIAMEDIMYIENNLKNLTYILRDGRRIASARRVGSFEDAVGEVAESAQFVQPHKSFFVNMKYISSMRGDSIIMDDGKVVPIARRRFGDTQEKYIRYISEGNIYE